MTTNSARQQAQQPSSTQDGQERQTSTEIQIPVLIRLPDVSESAAMQAASEAQIAWQNTPSLPEALSASEEVRAEPVPDNQRLSETSAKCETSEARTLESVLGRFTSSWPDFRLPSSVVRASVALLLIAVFVVAYTVIVGGGESTELAESKPAGGDKMPPVPAHTEGERSGLELDAFIPKIPETPRTSPAAPATAKQQAGKPAAQPPIAKAKAPPASQPNAAQLAKQKAAETKQSPAKPEQTAIAATAQAANVQQTDFKSPATSPQMQANQPADGAGAAGAENQWAPGFSNEIPQEHTASTDTARGGFYEGPLTSQPPAADANRFANPTAYPATNPASFQYPVNYHHHLLGADSRDSNRPASWPDEASVYGQQPSTARLQPRMDAPPIR